MLYGFLTRRFYILLLVVYAGLHAKMLPDNNSLIIRSSDALRIISLRE